MNEVLLLAGILVAVWAVLLFFRAPSIVIFLSLLVGQILASQVSEPLQELMGSYVQIPDIKYLQLALLLVPVVLSLVFLRFKVVKSKVFVEAISYLFVVATGLLFASDYLFALQQNIQTAEAQYGEYRAVILAVTSVLTLINAWLTYPRTKGKKKHSKH